VRYFETIEELRQALLEFPRDLQHQVADRAARISHTSRVPSEAASIGCRAA
jgi:hypothetical protein